MDDDDVDNEEDEDVYEDDDNHLRQSVPLSSIDIDIKIVRQKMILAEAGLEQLRVRIHNNNAILVFKLTN